MGLASGAGSSPGRPPPGSRAGPAAPLAGPRLPGGAGRRGALGPPGQASSAIASQGDCPSGGSGAGVGAAGVDGWPVGYIRAPPVWGMSGWLHGTSPAGSGAGSHGGLPEVFGARDGVARCGPASCAASSAPGSSPPGGAPARAGPARTGPAGPGQAGRGGPPAGAGQAAAEGSAGSTGPVSSPAPPGPAGNMEAVRGPGRGNALPGKALPEDPLSLPHGAHGDWLAAPVPLTGATVGAAGVTAAAAAPAPGGAGM